YAHLAIVYQETGRFADGKKTLDKGLMLRQDLAREFPGEAMYHRDLAVSYMNLGTFLAKGDRPREAESAYQGAIRISRKLRADYPTEPEHRKSLAMTLDALGTLLVDTGRADAAEASFREALPLLEELETEDPQEVEYAVMHARSLNNLARVYWLIHRPGD